MQQRRSARINLQAVKLQPSASHEAGGRSHVVTPAIMTTKKAGEGPASPAFSGRERGSARLLLLQLKDFVLDAELLALQIVDRLLVGKGAVDLLIDGAVEQSMLFSERLDAILHRHACPPRRL